MGIIAERDFSDAQVEHVALHELGHMKEKYDDPEGFLALLAECNADAENGKQRFMLYNSLMDDYVENNTANISPIFATDSDVVRDRYAKKGFSPEQAAARRASGAYPLHQQFADYLMMHGLGMGEDYLAVLGPKVQAIIEQGYRRFGRDTRFEDIVDRHLLPNTELQNLTGRDDSITERRRWIDKYILPTYLELLEQDREEVENQESQQGEGSGEQSEQTDGNENTQNTEQVEGEGSAMGQALKNEADQAEGAMKQWREILENAEAKKAEADMSDEEKAEKRRKDDLEKIWQEQEQASGGGNETGTTSAGERQGNFDDFYERLSKMKPISDQLKELWKRICHTDITEKASYQGHYRTGARLDIKQAIREMPTIQRRPNEAEIFQRKIHSQEKDVMPKNFSITLLLDESESMGWHGGKNIEAVKDFVIAMADSLGNFNSENQHSARRQKSEPVHASLEIFGYDTERFDILDLDTDIQIGDIMGAYGKIAAKGGTNDRVAFSHVLEKIKQNAQTAQQLKSGERVQIVLEITDGDTNSGDLRAELESMGVIVGGILIGGALVEKFDTNFPNNTGAKIDSIDELPEAVEQLIKNILDLR
jgi:hypothetical protein